MDIRVGSLFEAIARRGAAALPFNAVDGAAVPFDGMGRVHVTVGVFGGALRNRDGLGAGEDGGFGGGDGFRFGLFASNGRRLRVVAYDEVGNGWDDEAFGGCFNLIFHDIFSFDFLIV